MPGGLLIVLARNLAPETGQAGDLLEYRLDGEPVPVGGDEPLVMRQRQRSRAQVAVARQRAGRQFSAERAEGDVGLIVTGGYAPNWRGWLLPLGSMMTTAGQARKHRVVTDAVHSAAPEGAGDPGAKILLQVLHAGRYSYHPFSVGASTRKSRSAWELPFCTTSSGTRSRLTAALMSS